MTALSTLILPILLSAVGVFLLSSVIHMVTGWHKNDYLKLPNEDQVRAALRPLGIPPGDYMVPRPATSQEMRTPEFVEKVKQGPVLVVTVLPNGIMSMTTQLIMWFLYSAIVSTFAAYMAGHALHPAAPPRAIFRFVGLTAFIGYAVALWQMSIWYRRSWGTTFRATVDAVLYGVVTAFVFVWLWPK